MLQRHWGDVDTPDNQNKLDWLQPNQPSLYITLRQETTEDQTYNAKLQYANGNMFPVCLPRHTSCLHMIGQRDIMWPHIILPFLEPYHPAQDVPGMHTNTHVDFHPGGISHFPVMYQQTKFWWFWLSYTNERNASLETVYANNGQNRQVKTFYIKFKKFVRFFLFKQTHFARTGRLILWT